MSQGELWLVSQSWGWFLHINGLVINFVLYLVPLDLGTVDLRVHREPGWVGLHLS
jgi:hypothetical protein